MLAPRRAAVADRPWFWLRQVHGADVVVAPDDGEPGPAPGVEADAVVTRTDRWALAVHTADCAPVALVGEGGVLGVAHAGWQGLRAGVLERTVERMRALGAGAIAAFLGPCIHAECYEFGAADLDALRDRYGDAVAGTTRQGTPALDIPATVRAALASAGVHDLIVEPTCTACDPSCYSHRARRDRGRQALVAWLDRAGEP